VPEPITVQTTFKPLKFEQQVIAQIRSAITEELAEAVNTLKQESPVGATGDYQKGWSLIPVRRLPSSFELQATIRNSAEYATYAARGRGPGKFPPYKPGSPLAAWAVTKGIPAFLVARKIAREGTKLWRQGNGNNPLGLKRDGTIAPNSPIAQAEERIRARLRAVRTN